MKVGRWGGRIIAIVFGLLLTWLLLEVIFRVAYEQFPYVLQVPLREVKVTPFGEERILPPLVWGFDDKYQTVSRADVVDELQYPDPRVSFRLTTKNWLDPGSHVGFRVDSAEWEPRWPVDGVFVGDSFTFCYTAYDACWVEKLQAERGLSTVNLGMVATGSMSHLNALYTFGLPYEPRFVVWQWYGNDFNDDYGLGVIQGDIEDEEIYAEIEGAAEGSIGAWLAEHSAVYAVGKTLVNFQSDMARYAIYSDPYRASEGDVEINFGRKYTLEAYDLTLPKNQIGQARTEEVLLQAHSALTAQNIPLIVVLIPSKEEVYAELTVDELGEAGLDSLREGREAMGAFCVEHGVTCLDLMGGFSAENHTQLYWPTDTHLNPAGNQLLADTIWDFLLQAQLVE